MEVYVFTNLILFYFKTYSNVN